MDAKELVALSPNDRLIELMKLWDTELVDGPNGRYLPCVNGVCCDHFAALRDADVAEGKRLGAIEELEKLDNDYGEHPDEREDDIRERLNELRKNEDL